MPVHLAEVAFDVRENILVIFHDVAVGVDDEFCHYLSSSIHFVDLFTKIEKDFSLRSK